VWRVRFRAFDERAVEGLPARLWRAAGMRGGPAAWVAGVGELTDLRRGFVVVVLCLDKGRTGTQRGREAMQLFPLCGVEQWRSAIPFRSVPAALLG